MKTILQYALLGGYLKSCRLFLIYRVIFSSYEASTLSDINSWPINVIQEKVMHIPLSDVKSCIIPFLHN